MIFDDLEAQYRDFISKSGQEVLIYCPYIQVSVLKKILLGARSKISIITTWKTLDILNGISDLDLYPYCKSIGAYLYINQNIHLKVICDSYRRAIIGSANITGKGLGLAEKSNHECSVIHDVLDRGHQIYLRSILQEATLINEEEYQRTKELVDEYALKFKAPPDVEDVDFSKSLNKEFLISALPMSISIDTFFDYYSEKLVGSEYADTDYNCAMHDLALYMISPGLDRVSFNKQLKKAFFSQPFINELKKFIHKERYFGEIKEWVHNTCVDVPVPSRRDLTGNVQVLYQWFKELGKDEYVVDQPNHSERIMPRSFAAQKRK